MNVDSVDAIALGKRIRLLRRSRHWTQAELAGLVGIRTGPMNYLENGHHLPSLPVLHKLGHIFGVSLDQLLGLHPCDYVVGEPPLPDGQVVRQSEDIKWVGANDYRAQHALLVRFDPLKEHLTDGLLGALEKVIDAFFALEDICGVQKQARVPFQIPLPMRETGFDRYVGQVRLLLGVSDAVIFDYLELLENAGLRLVFLPLGKTVESVSCYDRVNANAFIFVNSEGLSLERQLFRLAYELGRVFLYNGGIHGTMRIGALDAEHAARRFASLFLMPAEAVLTSVRQVGVGPDQWTWGLLMRLKHRFGVSAEAFLYRLEELDLIGKSLRDRLKADIHAHYTANENAEPDRSRRVLTPNGRLGDLLLAAEIKANGNPELPGVRAIFKKYKIRMP